MTRFSELMSGQTLLPIIQVDTISQGISIAKAMADAGISLVEVVLRSETSLEALAAIKKECPSLLVGAGTITNSDILQRAIDAGSDFIVTPAVSEKLLSLLSYCPVPALPGVANTGDVLLATEFGFDELKFFPASLSGGAKYLSALSSIFQPIKFCPTGGINAENKQDYLTLNNVFAVGGTWVAKPDWVAEGNWQAITDSCKDALA